MKKMLALVLALVCILGLAGCNETASKNQETQAAVYSFSGKNDSFAISNGVVVFDETNESFYGGDLEIIQEEHFSDIASFSTTFYTTTGGEEKIILSNSVADTTGGSVPVDGYLGKISGDDVVAGSKIDGANELKHNLWFELATVDLSGKERIYQLQLTVTEITNTSNS